MAIKHEEHVLLIEELNALRKRKDDMDRGVARTRRELAEAEKQLAHMVALVESAAAVATVAATVPDRVYVSRTKDGDGILFKASGQAAPGGGSMERSVVVLINKEAFEKHGGYFRREETDDAS